MIGHAILDEAMEQELITVVIPVYNVSRWLGECLESIQRQTWKNLEILAVNDGSTDESRDIALGYAAQDPRITVLDKANGGLSDARNFGIAHAHGSFICFIDGDDTIAPEFCETLYEAIRDSDIAACDMEYVYEDGRREFSSGGSFEKTSVEQMPSLIRINNSACNKLYRTALFDQIQVPKGKLYEDLATVPIQIFRSRFVNKVNEPMYFYRQRSGSIQHHVDERVFDIYDAVDRIDSYVKSHGGSKGVQDEVHRMYLIYGLDIVTLKIKDMDEKEKRPDFLKKNMERLRQSCPDYKADPFYKEAPFKKKLIYWLLGKGMYSTVLRIYDR